MTCKPSENNDITEGGCNLAFVDVLSKLGIHLRSTFYPLSIQNHTLLVVREHIACLKPLQEASVVVAIPLADFAVHLHTTAA